MTSASSAQSDPLLADPADLGRCELTVVMPVYNEEASLPACAASWLAALDSLGIDHRLLIINDGSRDGTEAAVQQLNQHPRVLGITKPNQGHGPTILAGYRLATRTSEWTFQVDSDDEIPASAFAALWSARDGNDAVLGVRTGREQSAGRAAISRIAGLTTRLLLKGSAADANVPFRLMRSSTLQPLVDRLPPDTFAPNIIVAGVLSRDPATFAEVEVPHHERQTGQVSIVGMGALKAAAKSFAQTVRISRSVS